MVLCPSCGTVPDESNSYLEGWKLCVCQLLRFRTAAGGQWRYGRNLATTAGSVLIRPPFGETFLYRPGSRIEGISPEDVPNTIRLMDVASVLDS